MRPVDVDRLPLEQAQAWRRLWDTLLAPRPIDESRSDASLEARTATGETAGTEVPTSGNHSRSKARR
jgi:hypothetical protein